MNGLVPYLDPSGDKFASEEDSVLSYVALSVGPLGKEVYTMITHLSAIGYFHRVKSGGNSLVQMSRVHLTLMGSKRANGPTDRKSPFPLEDLMSLKGMLNLKDVDQLTLWESVFAGWFFILRMGEFLVTKSKFPPQGRHPIHMDDVQPLCKGAPTSWGERVGEISVRISGSKTDWVNQGCVRSHTRVSPTSPNADICVARAFVMMLREFPAKFRKRADQPLATWRNATPIPAEPVAA